MKAPPKAKQAPMCTGVEREEERRGRPEQQGFSERGKKFSELLSKILILSPTRDESF